MLNLFTIATKAPALEEMCRVWGLEPFTPVYQVRPGMDVPILIREQGQIAWRTGRWGLIRKGQEVYQTGIERILTQRPFNVLIRTQRCAIPANCFFGKPSVNEVRLVRILKERTFLLGGICYPDTSGHLRFTLLTCAPADILNDTVERMPVITSCQKVRDWLETEDMKRVMRYADRSGNFWFDFFRVSDEVLITGHNDRELLRPLGVSYQQWQAREETLQALQMREDRINRGNTKGRH